MRWSGGLRGPLLIGPSSASPGARAVGAGRRRGAYNPYDRRGGRATRRTFSPRAATVRTPGMGATGQVGADPAKDPVTTEGKPDRRVPSPSPATGAPPGMRDDREALREDLGRLGQVFLGLLSTGLAIVVLAQPQLSLDGLVLLLPVAVGFISAQTVLAGGRLFPIEGFQFGELRASWRVLQSLGIVGIGLVALALAVFAGVDPALAITAVVFVLALALVVLGFGRILQSN